MLLHYPTLLHTALITAALAVASRTATGDPRWTALAVIVIAAIAAAGGRAIGRHFFFAIVPVTLAVAVIALLFFVDSARQRDVLIGITAAFVYAVTLGSYRLSRNPRDAVARGMVIAAATTSVFFFYAALFAIALNFLVPSWAIGAAVFVVTTVVTWQYFVMIAPHDRFVQAAVYSLALGLVMTESTLIAALWPFGYLTTSIVLLMIYYVLWDLGQGYFLDRLSKVRLVTNVVFFLLLATIVLLTAQWMPTV